MGAIIEDQIRNSLGDANYDRVVEELGVMKDELVAYEEPGLYNDFLRRLKKKILQNELAGDRRELWWLIRRSNVGLIDKSVSELSNVTEQEAREVGSPYLNLNRFSLSYLINSHRPVFVLKIVPYVSLKRFYYAIYGIINHALS
jgi:hypothetical protein